MKRFLLNLAPLPGTACLWRQTCRNQAALGQKKKLSLSNLITIALTLLFTAGWSMLSVAQTQTYYSNGGYVVPPGVTAITITGVGGAGGSGGQDCGNGCGYNSGAPGRYVSQSFTVSPGTSLSVYIGSNGGNGGSNTSGGGSGYGGSGYYNGGSGGNAGTSGNSGGGGGGGGATAVIGSGVTLIAGGGGGGGGRCNTANSGTAGSYSTGGNGYSSGGNGSSSGSSDGAGGGGGGGGVNGGSGGGLYSLNGEFAGIGGNSGSSSSGNSTSTSSPYVTISYTANAGSISPSSQSICAGTQPSSLTLTGSAGYIQWQYSTNGSTFNNITGATSTTLTNTQMGTLTSTMYYRVVVSGIVSNIATVNVKALPTRPSGASCSSTTESTASLSWGASTAGDAITYYWAVGTSSGVTYNSGYTTRGTLSAPTTSITTSGLSANTTYYLSVYASTSCGNSGYQTSVPFITVPLAPVANGASVIRANSFTANWSASTGATSYYLDVATDASFTSFVPGFQNKNVGNVTSYSLAGLNNTTNYYYRVRAINAGGASVNSNTISLLTLPVYNFLIEKVGGGDIGTQLAGQPFGIKITARDIENTTVTDFNGNATITSNSVLTVGGSTANFTAGVLNSHSVTLTQAGISNKSLTVSIASPSVTSISNVFTVDPAGINEFILVANGTITAGTPFTVTATVYDQYGNLKTNYDGANEVMWSTTASSSLNGTARIIPANGNQTFNHGVAANISGFTFYNSMETPTITITDAPSSKPGTTAAITVLNAPLNSFKVVAGTSQISGIPYSATVTARDVYWNTCIDYTGNIYFNSSADYSPAGTITYTKEKQPFTGYNGVRTFSNLATINPVGVYWLSVTDEIVPGKSGQQQNIVVEPGAFEKSVSINLNPISTLEVDHTERVAGEDVVLTLTPRDAQGNLLYSCRDISVLLNGSNFHLAGANNTSVPIIVNNLGNGSYTATVRLTKSGANTISATFNDSDPIVTFDQTREIYVTPAATHHYVLNAPTDIIAGGARAPYTVSRYDIYNNLKTESAETVYLTSTSDGVNKGFYFESTDGIAMQSVTIADGSASANFWYYDEKAGNWIISASDASSEDGATGIIDAVDALTVNSAPFDHLALNDPNNITAGNAVKAAYTLILQDKYNNNATISGSTTTVSLSSSSTGTNKKFYTAASGGTTITQITLAPGVSSANFWYYDEKTGNHTITASAENMTNGTDEITVMPDLLKEFAVSGVSDPHDLGVLQSVTVVALDTYNNIKTDYVGTIMFGSSDLQAKKPAQYQFSEGDNGIHTFKNEVEFSQAGEFYLKVWDIDESPKYGFQYNITVQLAVTVTANARTKTYGDVLNLGTTEFTVTGTDYTDVNGNLVNPVIAGDITGVTLSCLGTVATTNVAGSPYTITPSEAIFKSGVNSDHYRVTYVDGTLTVEKRPVTVTAVTDTKTYDGTTSSLGSPTVGPLALTDEVNVSPTQEYDNKNYGLEHVLSASGLTIKDGSGDDMTGNYSITYTESPATGVINRMDVEVTAVTDTKTYDGTTSSLGSPTVGPLALTDEVNVSPTQEYDNKNYGLEHVLSASGLTIKDGSGDDMTGNYSITNTESPATGVINRMDVEVTAVTDTKTYDGTTSSLGSPTIGTLALTDEVNVSPTQEYDNKNYGLEHVLSASGLTIKDGSGDDMTGNYSITYTESPATGVINRMDVEVTAVTDTKTYDGTTSSLGSPTIGTLALTDEVNVSPTQEYDNKNYGLEHVLSASGLTIKDGSGDDMTGNYSITYTESPATGVINRMDVEVTAVTDTKTYDGTTSSLGSPTVGPLALTDEVNVSPTQEYDNKNYGLEHVLTASGLTIKDGSGDDMTGNYSITYTESPATGVINRMDVEVTAVTDTKTYDGTTSSLGSPTIGTLALTDEVNVSPTQEYDNKNYGLEHVLSASGLTIKDGSGDDMTGNYSITYTESPATGVINRMDVEVTAVTDTKTYDGTTSSLGSPTIGTLALTDEVNVSPTQEYDNKNYGLEHVLSASGLTIKDGSGDDMTGNYSITYTESPATGVINRMDVEVTAVTDTKTYDGTTSSLGSPTVGPLALTDEVNVSPTQEYDNKNYGLEHVLSASGLTIKDGSGDDMTGNYSITYTESPATGVINRMDVEVTAVTDTKTYDGTTSSLGSPTVGPLALTDEVNVSPTQEYDNKNYGLEHVLSASGLTIKDGSGDDMTGNYSITYTESPATGVINKMNLEVTASVKNKFYGTLLIDGVGSTEFTSVGLQIDDIIESVTVAYGAGAEATAIPETYTGSVSISAATGDTFAEENYTINYVNGDIVVEKAILTVTANAQRKGYGYANPALTFRYSGWVNGEEIIDIPPSISTNVNVSTFAGYYVGAIKLSGGIDNNYTFNYIDGNFEVDAPVVTIPAIAGDTNGDGKITDPEIAGDINGDGKITYPEIAGDINGDGKIDGYEVAGDKDGNGIINGDEIAGDINGDGKITDPEIAGDTNGDGKITYPEIAGDINGDGKIDGNEVAGDKDGNGIINGDEIAGDINGDGKITDPEIAGDINGDGKITYPEIAGDTNGDGKIDGYEVAGDKDGNGIINGDEIAGDINGDGKITDPEIAGDTNGDGKITYPEIAGDINGDGKIDGNEVAGDKDGNGIINGDEIAGDINGDGKITDPEIAGDINGDGKITDPEIAGDTNGDGKIDGYEVAGDKDGNGIINGDEIAGDINGDGKITDPEIAGDINGDGKIDGYEVAGDKDGNGIINGDEIAGDINGDGKITDPEIAGDTNGDGKIDGDEVAGDKDGNGIIDSNEIAGDINGDGEITSPEVTGDINGNGSIDGNEIHGDSNGNGTIDETETTTGIDNPDKLGELIAWAVRNTEIRLKGEIGKLAVAKLYDIDGRLILVKNLEEGSFNIIPAPYLKTGIYMLFVKDNGKIEGFKIPVKE